MRADTAGCYFIEINAAGLHVLADRKKCLRSPRALAVRLHACVLRALRYMCAGGSFFIAGDGLKKLRFVPFVYVGC